MHQGKVALSHVKRTHVWITPLPTAWGIFSNQIMASSVTSQISSQFLSADIFRPATSVKRMNLFSLISRNLVGCFGLIFFFSLVSGDARLTTWFLADYRFYIYCRRVTDRLGGADSHVAIDRWVMASIKDIVAWRNKNKMTSCQGSKGFQTDCTRKYLYSFILEFSLFLSLSLSPLSLSLSVHTHTHTHI